MVFVGKGRVYNRRFLQMCGHYLGGRMSVELVLGAGTTAEARPSLQPINQASALPVVVPVSPYAFHRKMTAAYAVVANGGYRVQPTGVLAVLDGRGQVRASFLETTRSRVIPEKCIPPTRAVLKTLSIVALVAVLAWNGAKIGIVVASGILKSTLKG